MPCAIVIGAAPVIAYTGPQKLSIDLDEITVAGALAGVPIRTAKAVTVPLKVPADAEIVIEGFIDTDLLEPEGPFGESNGYVALEDFNMSMEVTEITHRTKPVFISIISQVPPSESSVIKKLAREPLYLNYLRESLSLKSVLRVVMHEPLSNLRPHNLCAIRERYASDGGLARITGDICMASRQRKDRDCGELGYRS